MRYQGITRLVSRKNDLTTSWYSQAGLMFVGDFCLLHKDQDKGEKKEEGGRVRRME